MRVVIATAEPFGAYHLTALSDEMAACAGVEFQHLIPYPTYTQGHSSAEPVADLAVLDDADRLVLSGGGLTAWTHAAADYARRRGLPVYMMELAYGTLEPQPLAPDACAGMSSAGAARLAEAFALARGAIPVLGNPQLDQVTPWAARYDRAGCRTGPILLVSTSELPTRDPQGLLRQIGDRLADAGLRVQVAPHPREDLSYWAGFEFARVQDSAHECQVALGYPGSVWSYLAAAGVPTIGVSSGSTLDGIPAEIAQAAHAWVRSPEEVNPQLLSFARPANDAVVHALCGPLGGAAGRIVDFFVS